MVKGGLDVFILKFYEPLQICYVQINVMKCAKLI